MPNAGGPWQPVINEDEDEAALTAQLELNAEAHAALQFAGDVHTAVRKFSATVQADEAAEARREDERIAEVAREMDPKQRTRPRHPLLLAMDRKKTVDLSNKAKTKEQAHIDEVVRAMNPKLRYAR